MRGWRGSVGSARVVVLLAGMALIGLTWLGTLSALTTEQRTVVAHENAELANKVLLLETQIRRQLLAVDQTLRILQREWERDPAGFDLKAWQRRAKVFADRDLQVYIADPGGIVRASTRADRVGTDIAGQEAFRNRADLPADDDQMFIGIADTAPTGEAAPHGLVQLTRRLEGRDGKLAGVIGVDYSMLGL